jgi:hypothetical protein
MEDDISIDQKLILLDHIAINVILCARIVSFSNTNCDVF